MTCRARKTKRYPGGPFGHYLSIPHVVSWQSFSFAEELCITKTWSREVYRLDFLLCTCLIFMWVGQTRLLFCALFWISLNMEKFRFGFWTWVDRRTERISDFWPKFFFLVDLSFSWAELTFILSELEFVHIKFHDTPGFSEDGSLWRIHRSSVVMYLCFV